MLTQLVFAFGILAICVLIHVSGLMLLTDQLKRHISPDNDARLWRDFSILIVAFAVMVALHTLETMIWAIFYQSWQLFSNFETSLYFSLTSYTTIGFGDVVLPDRWRLLGGIEGISGILLSGLSTAFLFVIVSTIQQTRGNDRSRSI
jgi:hypothetical protein